MAAMHDDLASLRRAISALQTTKQRRRYPAALRARLTSFVRSHPERSIRSIARALDVAPQTLARIAAAAAPVLVPVRIVDDAPAAGVRVHVRGPRGIVIEGLDLAGVAALIRELA